MSEPDDLVDERAQLFGLGVQVVEDRGALFGRDVGEPAQRVEVRAQARQGRAQLVPGVLNQAFLFLLAADQSAQHAGEAAAQAGDLVG